MKKNKKSIKPSVKKAPKRRLVKSAADAASAFLSSEEGKMVKKDIVKSAIALGLIAGAADTAHAQHTDTAHADYLVHNLNNTGNAGSHSSGPHTDAAHADHANHGSHGSGGWC